MAPKKTSVSVMPIAENYCNLNFNKQVAARKLCIECIIGGNYCCKFIIKVRSAKNENDSVFLAFSQSLSCS